MLDNNNISIKFLEKMNQKLAKNRESAKNSRKRKKIYIELLENKVNYLNSKIELIFD